MFKQGLAILLIFCTLAGSFTKVFVFAGFELNQKYIASTLCENRDKPWMNCHGKCYLMKKVKAAEEKEKNEERETQKNLIQQAFCSSVTKIKFSSQLLQIFPERYQPMALQSVSLNLLRPPRLAS